MKKNKSKKNIKKRVIIIFIIIIILGGIGTYVHLKSSNKTEDSPKSKVVDSIKKYGYTIDDNDTKLFKTKFKELKRVLSASNIDNQKYSELVAELFIIDFFSLDNKITKNDIGGVQFVYENYKTTFIDKARDEFYKYVKNNLNNNRKQELPVVSTIKVESSDTVTPSEELNTEEFKNIEEAYKINLSWTYEQDLGYESEATLIVVKDGNLKFSVAKLYNEDDKDTDKEDN